MDVLGAMILRSLRSGGELALLFWESLLASVRQAVLLRVRYRQCVEQMYQIGVQSLPIVVFSVTFVSMMLITEFSFHMKLVLRQDSLVPAFSTVLMLRELGPMVACLLLTSRVGAAIAAEIASMKSTEQIDALRLLSIDPVDYLVPPRWLGCVFAAVSLSLVSLGAGLAGGAVLAAASLGQSAAEFFNTMFTFARWDDVLGCVIKALVFGTVIPMVAAHHGFRARGGSEGVGEAATGAVVQGSILIIAADFVLTYFLYAL